MSPVLRETDPAEHPYLHSQAPPILLFSTNFVYHFHELDCHISLGELVRWFGDLTLFFRFPLNKIKFLEFSQYLEDFLWPRFDLSRSSLGHVMSIAIMMNEKFRERVSAWEVSPGRVGGEPGESGRRARGEWEASPGRVGGEPGESGRRARGEWEASPGRVGGEPGESGRRARGEWEASPGRVGGEPGESGRRARGEWEASPGRVGGEPGESGRRARGEWEASPGRVGGEPGESGRSAWGEWEVSLGESGRSAGGEWEVSLGEIATDMYPYIGPPCCMYVCMYVVLQSIF